MEKIATRDGFGQELVKLGKENPKIVVVSADLEDATRAEYFKHQFPDRFFSVGIAEQDMIGMAAGLSSMGFVAVTNSFAVFMTNRAYDMIRMDVCYNNCNVKIVCSHAGVTVGEDGASAQCLEDFALMRVLPNIKVICPVDSIEAAKATRAIINEDGPMYLRTSRAPLPVITKPEDPFVIGKANVVREGKHATVIACGIQVSEALSAAEELIKEGIDLKVVNMHTIKPIDREMIVACARTTGAIVTAEEHQRHGGLGGAVAEVLSTEYPAPLEMVAVDDSFGESGTPDQLLTKYGLRSTHIVLAVKKAIARKKK